MKKLNSSHQKSVDTRPQQILFTLKSLIYTRLRTQEERDEQSREWKRTRFSTSIFEQLSK